MGESLDTHPNAGARHTYKHTRTLTRERTYACAPPWTPSFGAQREGGELPASGGSHGPARSPFQELVEVVHLHLVKEYITRLSKRSLVLKTVEQQQQLAGHILANDAAIQLFCAQNVRRLLPAPPPSPARAPPPYPRPLEQF